MGPPENAANREAGQGQEVLAPIREDISGLLRMYAYMRTPTRSTKQSINRDKEAKAKQAEQTRRGEARRRLR